ncbi:MAG: hypothetical protein EOO63_09130 [Hymenobacter sp.]|nr:MAG: hypothetical protein EOO63_09130 [Hymenobacter sp.]
MAKAQLTQYIHVLASQFLQPIPLAFYTLHVLALLDNEVAVKNWPALLAYSFSKNKAGNLRCLLLFTSITAGYFVPADFRALAACPPGFSSAA